MNNELRFDKPRDAWQALFDSLMLLTPLKLLALLKGEAKRTKHHPLTRIVPVVIVTLSVASVSNLVSRASHHHPGLPADATGTAIAVLVPIAVFAAVHSNLGVWRKVLISLIALVFAATSSFIQFQIYAPSTGFEMTSDLFEALAFGAGVPIAECLLAVIEFLLLEQDASMNKAIEQAAKDEEAKKALEAERKAKEIEATENARVLVEQQRQENERQARIKEAHEQALFELELEQKRLEMQAKIEADRLKLEAKLQKTVEKSAKPTVENSTPATGSDDNSTGKKAKIQQRRNMIFQHIKMYGDPGASALGEQFGVDRGTIYGDLKALVGDGAIYKNGDGGYHTKERE